MQPMPIPLTRDLVLIGGGHTHALVLADVGDGAFARRAADADQP